MKEWKDILVELTRKLTALFAFVVMLVIVIALLGRNIPEAFSALIYILSIGGLLVYALLQFFQIRGKYQQDDSTRACHCAGDANAANFQSCGGFFHCARMLPARCDQGLQCGTPDGA
jgi:hypothetical protein